MYFCNTSKMYEYQMTKDTMKKLQANIFDS